jgi:hypothetical protein
MLVKSHLAGSYKILQDILLDIVYKSILLKRFFFNMSKLQIQSAVRIMIRLALTLVCENKNLKGKYSRDYHEQMFKKAKMQFIEFYGLFHYFNRKSAEEKRTFTSLIF